MVHAVPAYYQDSFKKTMPPTSFNGKGWGIDPKIAPSSCAELTADNCVLWLVEYAYAGVDNKTKKLAWICDPEKSACTRCRCKDRQCSLVEAGGSFRQRRPPEPAAFPVPAGSALDTTFWRRALSWLRWRQVPKTEGSVAPDSGNDGDVSDDVSNDDPGARNLKGSCARNI